MAVQGPLDFSLVGILAGLSKVLAAARVSIFVISTYDTDMLMVKDESLDAAVAQVSSDGTVFWSRPGMFDVMCKPCARVETGARRHG